MKIEKTGWYKCTEGTEWFVYYDLKKEIAYGFECIGDWFLRELTSSLKLKPSVPKIEPATEQEATERLKSEAIKRGYVEGAEVECLCYEQIETINSNNCYFGCAGFYVSGTVIMKDGKWAEITKHADQPQENEWYNLSDFPDWDFKSSFPKAKCIEFAEIVNGHLVRSKVKNILESYFLTFNPTHFKVLEYENQTQEKTFPRMMEVRYDEDQEWEKKEIQFVWNNMAWNFVNIDNLLGWEQYREIDNEKADKIAELEKQIEQIKAEIQKLK